MSFRVTLRCCAAALLVAGPLGGSERPVVFTNVAGAAVERDVVASGPVAITGDPGFSVCPPAGRSRAALEALRSSGFACAPEERQRLALELLACFDHPDPALRDGVVFAALSQWLRAGELEPTTVRSLSERLTPALRGAADAQGFRRPFAALILSEVARADRLEPVLSEPARADLVEAASAYLSGVTDFRAFDPVEGWRHGVAHGADLVLQLGLNPAVGERQVRQLLAALASRIAPAGQTFYSFGEPERLARAVFFVHARGVLDDAFWSQLFATLGDPRPLDDWAEAYESLEGLARRHNTMAFLHAVSFAGRRSGEERGDGLARLADREVARLMGG